MSGTSWRDRNGRTAHQRRPSREEAAWDQLLARARLCGHERCRKIVLGRLAPCGCGADLYEACFVFHACFYRHGSKGVKPQAEAGHQ